ncbi:MAG: glycosyltransferase family 4 protein [Taibaiella sp.]|nr:glycosyltransferase family 4 protein [Taibaiella sp.]
MRILLLSNEYPPGPGGIGNHAYHLTKELIAQGNELIVCTTQNYASVENINAFNKSEPYQVVSLGSSSGVSKYISRLYIIMRLYRSFRPAVIVATGGFSLWSIYLLKKYFKGSAIVSVAHGGEVTESNKLRRYLTAKGLLASDKVICVSHYTQKKVLERGVDKRNTAVIFNGADVNRFFPVDEYDDIIEQYGLKNKKILLTVGSVDPRKGHDIALRALPIIRQQHPDIIYLIIGKRQEWPDLEEIIARYNLKDNIRFTGILSNEEIVKAYNACDVYTLPSRHTSWGDFEGFGISVIEAALCAKPAVVTNDCGLEDAVEDTITGYHVPQEDPVALAEKIIKLLDNAPLRKQLGENARKRACNEFDWKLIGEKYFVEIENAR